MPLAVYTALLEFIRHHKDLNSKRFVVGYSGGQDSHVLLHTLSLLLPPTRLKAIHVNHQLHIQAEKWAQHCQDTARALDIACDVVCVNVDLQKGESLEAKARQVRYDALQKQLTLNDILLTAHTQDDQAETLLLQLIRGAGVQGLSAMSLCKSLGLTLHYRPLLAISRADIKKASHTYGLKWITDDSNDNTRFDRNFIRHDILPLLKTRFKGVIPNLARSAQLCQEAANLQTRQAQKDLSKIVICKNQIKTAPFITLPFERQKAVIRYWIAQNGYLYPSKAKLQDMIRQMNTARLDASPCITWGKGMMLRRYRDHWYLLPPNSIRCMPLAFETKIVQGQGIRLALVKEISELKLTYKQGGEQCKPAGGVSKSLKKWFQCLQIPTWMRAGIPLIYYQSTLIGVVGYFICEGWQASEQEEGLEIVLTFPPSIRS